MAFLRRVAVSMATLATLMGLAPGPITLPLAWAQPSLQSEGTIKPAEAVYTFEGKAGEVVTITLESEDFDPVLSLLNADAQEIAFNDDFGGSLNSTIIFEIPANGTYTVVARSFSGGGGDYRLVVRPATEFEVALAAAETLVLSEDYPAAIAAYTQAVELDPNQPTAYLGRAQATLGQIYAEQGEALQGPEDIPLPARQSVIEDFEKAANLLAADGSQDWADSLREQAEFLRSAGTQ
ncbi:MAG TPA: tetratricopeptide repeat protein [Leptolyngbyaceae cyanobacterium M65_K2018_010]|nr:tetratricopeptide repeat protein [Leptolyngbyaceae cyanobacterium M65_K2018_010]